MDLATIAALYRYNSWAHEQVLHAVSRVPQADFTRDVKSSHGSIRDTLTHVVWSEWIWLQRWKGLSPRIIFPPADFPTADLLLREVVEACGDSHAAARSCLMLARRVAKSAAVRSCPFWVSR